MYFCQFLGFIFWLDTKLRGRLSKIPDFLSHWLPLFCYVTAGLASDHIWDMQWPTFSKVSQQIWTHSEFPVLIALTIIKRTVQPIEIASTHVKSYTSLNQYLLVYHLKRTELEYQVLPASGACALLGLNTSISSEFLYSSDLWVFLVNKYLIKVNNRNTRKRSEICQKLAINSTERRH